MVISQNNPQIKAMDYDDLTRTIKYLLDAAWGEGWGNFTPDGPNLTDPHNVDYPFIVHYIENLQPGIVGKDTREIRPRLRHFVQNDDVNGTGPPGTKIYGQVFDANVVFEVWEETNAQVSKLAKEFRNTLNMYTGFLKSKGLREIQFVAMETDMSTNKIRDSYKVRKLTYFVKFEEVTEVPTDIFRVMEVVDAKLEKEAKDQLGE